MARIFQKIYSLTNSRLHALSGLAILVACLSSLIIPSLPLDFDSSYNLLIARTFALTGRYATPNYIIPGQEFFPFDCWITTGFPVLGLTGLVWSLTGIHEAIARVIMTGWAILFLALCITWIVRLLPGIHWSLTTCYVLSLYIALDMHYMGINTLGEIPAGVFLLSAMLIIKKNRGLSPFLFGILLGSSAVTKLMMVFGAVPLGFIYVIREGLAKRYKHAILAVIGGLVPFVIQLFWIQSQIPLTEWYGLQKSVWATQGAGLILQAFESFPSFISRIGALATHDPLYLISGVLLLHLYCSEKQFRRIELTPILCLFLFFLLLQNADTPRHLIISKFLMLSFVAPALWVVYSQSSLSRLMVRTIGTALLLLCLKTAFSRYFVALQPLPAAQSQREFAQFIKTDMAKARIFFPGWWKAPEIQILSGRRFILYDKANLPLCRNQCYLLVDPLMQMLAPGDVANVQKEFGDPVIEHLGYKLHRVNAG